MLLFEIVASLCLYKSLCFFRLLSICLRFYWLFSWLFLKLGLAINFGVFPVLIQVRHQTLFGTTSTSYLEERSGLWSGNTTVVNDEVSGWDACITTVGRDVRAILATERRLAPLIVLFVDLPPALVNKDTNSSLSDRLLIGKRHFGHSNAAWSYTLVWTSFSNLFHHWLLYSLLFVLEDFLLDNVLLENLVIEL